MSDTIEQKKNSLQQEIAKLREEYQVELPKRIAEARGHGDLSENSEFHAARERQAFVKVRIGQLTRYLHQLREAEAQADETRVGFGSVVAVLERNTNTRCEFTIVHAVDVDLAEGRISIASPVGAALHNRTVGEEVVVNVPVGERRYYIEKITTLHGSEITAEAGKQPGDGTDQA